jgi:hypothetical protein
VTKTIPLPIDAWNATSAPACPEFAMNGRVGAFRRGKDSMPPDAAEAKPATGNVNAATREQMGIMRYMQSLLPEESGHPRNQAHRIIRMRNSLPTIDMRIKIIRDFSKS